LTSSRHQIRHNFVSSSTFTYPAFVGALTVVGETALVVFRWKRIVRPLTIVAVEVAWTVLLWIFWIAAAANTTSVTSGLLDYCGSECLRGDWRGVDFLPREFVTDPR
jgi:hypothetical protein